MNSVIMPGQCGIVWYKQLNKCTFASFETIELTKISVMRDLSVYWLGTREGVF